MASREGFRDWWQRQGQPLPTEAELRAEAAVRLLRNPPETYAQQVYDDKFRTLVADLGSLAHNHTPEDN